MSVLHSKRIPSADQAAAMLSAPADIPGSGPLDGGSWPRSTDPVAELPGLVLAIDHLRGPVRQLILNAQGWDSHPRRLGVAGRATSRASPPPC
jgi:hypothetical protein